MTRPLLLIITVHPEGVEASTEVVSTMLGRPVEMSCTSIGLPVPDVVWLKDGTPLVPDKRVRVQISGVRSKLTFSKVTLHDWGEYKCVATNILGKHSKTFHLSDGIFP